MFVKKTALGGFVQGRLDIAPARHAAPLPVVDLLVCRLALRQPRPRLSSPGQLIVDPLPHLIHRAAVCRVAKTPVDQSKQGV
jgi:hypothetical protein